MPRVIESREEFIRRQGAGRLLHLGRGEYLLANGSRVVETTFDTRFFEPPAHPEKRYELQIKYWTRMEEAYTAEFDKLKTANAPPPSPDYIPATPYRWNPEIIGTHPSQDAVECLKWLRDRVKECRKQLATIERKYNALPEVIEANRRAAEQARRDAEMEADRAEQERLRVAEVKSITLDD